MITSILDNDLYKFTMMNAVLKKAPDTQVTYQFYNRGNHFLGNHRFFNALCDAVKSMANLKITDDELDFLRESCPFFDDSFLAYLKNFRFNPSNVKCHTLRLQDHSIPTTFGLHIEGNWAETILWEVPLMAMISELYYKHCDTDWVFSDVQLANQVYDKSKILKNCQFADFGTRRRRGYKVQDKLVNLMRNMNDDSHNFVGTSNVHFAMKYGLKPIGTMAHEWVMGMSVLEGLRHANRFALEAWNDVYKGRLGIALTDTYGSDAFFNDFDGTLARTFDGVRHDSGDPGAFATKVVKFYQSMGIDPSTKTIVFSDGLTPASASILQWRCQELGINCSFGIGTNFTNDFEGSPAMNMVIKLDTVNGVSVVKLSDEPGKVTGDSKAVDVAKWTFKTKVTCKTCDGSGKVHSHNPQCWDCSGKGVIDA